jgi:pimeloyl-ACP methyl ester carboxylesterase
MAILEVPGAQLYYEVWGGDGPLLLLIPGGNGDADSFAPVASRLATRYTVVSYDRRGFSRSPLAEPPDDSKRIGLDVDDASRLIEHAGTGQADVLGSSSGAIVALELLSRRPGQVRTLVAHEPPLMTLLSDADEQLAFTEAVHATYQREGLQAAMGKFAAGMGLRGLRPPGDAELPAPLQETMTRTLTNLEFWIEHELLVYPRLTPDMEALRAHSAQLVLAGGDESREKNLPPCRPNMVLAERLGLTVVDFPGDHVGYGSHAAAFADQLVAVIASRAG